MTAEYYHLTRPLSELTTRDVFERKTMHTVMACACYERALISFASLSSSRGLNVCTRHADRSIL